MAKMDGLTLLCPGCSHEEWMHPESTFAPTDRFWCGECGHDFGTWAEVHSRLFTGPAMLDAVLNRRPGAPTD